MSKVADYLKETKSELAHVAWPTRRQSAVFTVLVIVISILTAAYLGVFDFIFSYLLSKVI